MISKLHQLNLHDKIKYIYATVIKFMILSGIVSIICLSLLDIRFNSYVKGAQKANNAAKESIIDISSAARNIREMAYTVLHPLILSRQRGTPSAS